MSAPAESKQEGLLIPVIIAVGLFMATLDSTIIAISIPQMAASLGESPLRLNLAITSYLLSLAVFLPVSGYLADCFGTRNVFCTAIGLFTISSAFCRLADSLQEMVIGRSMQGIGGAMTVPVLLPLMLQMGQGFNALQAGTEGKVRHEKGAMTDAALNKMDFYVEGVVGKLPGK